MKLKRHRFSVYPPMAALLLGFSHLALSQTLPPTDLRVEAPDLTGQALKRQHIIEVKLSRSLSPEEGQVAICIGPLDLSRQTRAVDATTFRAELKGTQLPVGAHDVTVHLIRGNQWLDLAKFAVTVASDGDGEAAASSLESRLTIGVKGQIHERVLGITRVGERPRFQDLTINGGLNWTGKALGWDLKSGANITGVSNRPEALRFGVDGSEAVKLDLNDYNVEFNKGDAKFAVGHLSYGNHPLLLNNHSSRGVSVGYALTPWLDVSASAMRATSIVGFDDLFGLTTASHQIYSATVGVEMLPNKKGLLRTELSFINASALPQSNFNQGQIPDAEQNRGIGLRLSSSDPDGRWKAEGLWARSRYVNPSDPALAQGSTLVTIKAETRDAYQAQASYLLVKDAKWLSDKYPVNIRATAQYDYAEPLFKSLGASFLADQRALRYSTELRMGEIVLTLESSRRNDNVTTIPTILKVGTYEKSTQLSLPLPSLLASADRPANAWPQVQLEWRQVNQYTLRVPDGTDARSSFWPDQLNTTFKAGLNWNYEPFTVSYNLEIAEQDNRQPERDNADFFIQTHGFTVAWRASDKLSVNFGLNRSRNYSYENTQATYNNGGTLSIDWQISEVLSLRADYAKSIAFDSLNQQYSNTLSTGLQLARKFTLQQFGKKLPGQVFVRVAFANNRSLDSVVAQVLSGKQLLVQTGLSLNF